MLSTGFRSYFNVLDFVQQDDSDNGSETNLRT